MKNLFIVVATICIMGILVLGGFSLYNKFQLIQLDKERVELQKEFEGNQALAEGNNENNTTISNAQIDTSQQHTNDGSEYVEVHAGSHRTVAKQELENLKVNRDNVFDYLIAGIN